MKYDHRDGGYKSRKLWFAVGICIGIFFGACLAAYWPAFGPNYEVMVGGLLGAGGLYLTGNVASRVLMAKHAPRTFPAQQAAATNEEEEGGEDERC